MGQKHPLISGSKVYTLEGYETELDKLAVEKATVTGAVNGDVATLASVAPAMKAK